MPIYFLINLQFGIKFVLGKFQIVAGFFYLKALQKIDGDYFFHLR
jgi:hypothetical protein